MAPTRALMLDDPAAMLPAVPARARHSTGRIGPNAVTRLAEALASQHGEACCASVFAEAELACHLQTPPQAMVDETEVVRLHRALVALLGTQSAMAVAQDAGQLTGRYLLEHRIPAAAQRLLRRLPRAIAARLLTAAIARHAWTFAGSGCFRATFRGGPTLSLAGAPLCTDAAPTGSAYLAATFDTIFAAMLGPRTLVRETSGMGNATGTCTFAVRW